MIHHDIDILVLSLLPLGLFPYAACITPVRFVFSVRGLVSNNDTPHYRLDVSKRMGELRAEVEEQLKEVAKQKADKKTASRRRRVKGWVSALTFPFNTQ